MLSAPLRSRFSGGVFKLEFYSHLEMEQIIYQSAVKLNISITDGGVHAIAGRSRSTPRTANYFLKRVRDYAEVHETEITEEIVLKALSMIGVDDIGLRQTDRDVLLTIIEKFNGGPVGVKTIATATHEEIDSIENVIEPYLIQKGLLELTPRGRVVTREGYDHFGKEGFEEKK
jgi:Holliday junction DNA helicase RuvB